MRDLEGDAPHWSFSGNKGLPTLGKRMTLQVESSRSLITGHNAPSEQPWSEWTWVGPCSTDDTSFWSQPSHYKSGNRARCGVGSGNDQIPRHWSRMASGRVKGRVLCVVRCPAPPWLCVLRQVIVLLWAFPFQFCPWGVGYGPECLSPCCVVTRQHLARLPKHTALPSLRGRLLHPL